MTIKVNEPAHDGRGPLDDAKRKLGVEHLVLQIHDASFPADPDEDVGRGSPYTRGAERFFAFAARLGFDAIQLGPRGMTGPGNGSPYDATIFSRNPLNLPLTRLVDQGRLPKAAWTEIHAALQISPGGTIPYRLVYEAYQPALEAIAAAADPVDRAAASAYLAANETWLVPDALYDPLCVEHGGKTWTEWHRGHWDRSDQARLDQRLFHPSAGQQKAAENRLAALRSQFARRIEDFALVQWLLEVEHRDLRKKLAKWGLAMFGDLQVGLAPHDAWRWQGIFLPQYQLGAPPSRTTPQGQPWGYPVYDPAQFGTPREPGAALQFVRARLDRLLAECDGIRIDHPHGWIDPWVYRSGEPDPYHAVQNGARLFSSPDDPRHPELQPLAIPRLEQIDRSQLAYADDWVRALDDEQVARYSILVDLIVAAQAAHGRPEGVVACEVLSTLPYPIRRVLERHRLGRFRVTQKINLADPDDVYRIEHAAPEDWIMLGTHDTPTVWELAHGWCRSTLGEQWGRYLAAHLVDESRRREFADRIAVDPGQLVHGLFAAMLASRARHVVVFFPDLFGMTARYNEPGVVSDANWSLRVPADFERYYEERRLRGDALDVARCVQMALQCSA